MYRMHNTRHVDGDVTKHKYVISLLCPKRLIHTKIDHNLVIILRLILGIIIIYTFTLLFRYLSKFYKLSITIQVYSIHLVIEL